MPATAAMQATTIPPIAPDDKGLLEVSLELHLPKFGSQDLGLQWVSSMAQYPPGEEQHCGVSHDGLPVTLEPHLPGHEALLGYFYRKGLRAHSCCIAPRENPYAGLDAGTVRAGVNVSSELH